MLNEKESKEKEILESDLLFYLSYYKDVGLRTKRIKAVFDKEIEEISNRLKKIGN